MAEAEGLQISLVMIFLIVLILIAAITAVAIYVRRRRINSLSSAEKKLDDRFARGDISAEEYRNRLQELEGHSNRPPENKV